ncbi:MAG: hypothetical protein U1F52_04595 [Burkholderiales bacterium]
MGATSNAVKPMSGPRTYIVRIYRQGFRSLTGTLEDADTGGVRGFQSVEELGKHLHAPIPAGRDPLDGEVPIDAAPKGD